MYAMKRIFLLVFFIQKFCLVDTAPKTMYNLLIIVKAWNSSLSELHEMRMSSIQNNFISTGGRGVT